MDGSARAIGWGFAAAPGENPRGDEEQNFFVYRDFRQLDRNDSRNGHASLRDDERISLLELTEMGAETLLKISDSDFFDVHSSLSRILHARIGYVFRIRNATPSQTLNGCAPFITTVKPAARLSLRTSARSAAVSSR